MVNNFTDYLCHHGIKGQKWGVRRFQNPDGSLTDEGRRRYLDRDGSITKEGMSEMSENYNKNHSAEIAVIGTHVGKWNNAADSLVAATKEYAEKFGDDSELGKKQKEYTDEWLDNNSGFDAAWFDRKNGWTDSRTEQVEEGIALLAGEIMDGPMTDMFSSAGEKMGKAADNYSKETKQLGKSILDYTNKAVNDTYKNIGVSELKTGKQEYQAKELASSIIHNLSVGEYPASLLVAVTSGDIYSNGGKYAKFLFKHNSSVSDSAYAKAMEMATDYFKSRYPDMYREYEWERDMGSAWDDSSDPTNDDLDFWRD